MIHCTKGALPKKKPTKQNLSIRMPARRLFEYGESREGYWISDKFMKQIARAVDVAEPKDHKKQGYRHFGFWIRVHAIQRTMRTH
jgi:hypothetical protein